MKANRNRIVTPRVVQLIAAVRRVHDFDAKPGGRVRKHARLVAGGRGKQEHSPR